MELQRKEKLQLNESPRKVSNRKIIGRLYDENSFLTFPASIFSLLGSVGQVNGKGFLDERWTEILLKVPPAFPS